MRQHRWCECVCISENALHVCWICPIVWIGRSSSVVNLPSVIHSALQRSHLLDSFAFLILCCQHLMESCVCLLGASSAGPEIGLLFPLATPPPILSRFSPLRRCQSLVKVAKIDPFWCGRKSRLYSFCPSSLSFDTTIKDFVFSTTVPCRLIVRFPHPWGRFLYVGCVPCTISPLLFIVLLVGLFHVTSFCSLWWPISPWISTSSKSRWEGPPCELLLSLIKLLLPLGLSFVVWV